MANDEHVRRLLESDRDSWNAWRGTLDGSFPDLSGANLYHESSNDKNLFDRTVLNLARFDLSACDFRCVDFSRVDTTLSDFGDARMNCTWFRTDQQVPQKFGSTIQSKKCDDEPHCLSKTPGRSFVNCQRLCADLMRPNETHVDILLKGVDAWNDWRYSTSEVPDLSGLDLEKKIRMAKMDGIELRGANFSGAVLRGAKFAYLDLRKSTFERADLRCAEFTVSDLSDSTFRRSNWTNGAAEYTNMSGCNFARSTMASVRFKAVNLHSSNFRESDIRRASFKNSGWGEMTDLSQSDFTDAHLCDADLSRMDLATVEFSESMAWKSRVFRAAAFEPPRWKNAQQPTELRDVESLMSVLESFGFGMPTYATSRTGRSANNELRFSLYMRGEDRDYKLRPKLMRNPGWSESEDKLMLDLMARRPGELGSETSYFQRLAMARHFELPTRLLDVTRSASVALHYATANETDGVDGFLHFFLVPNSLVKTFDSDTVCLVANFVRLTPLEKAVLLTYRRPEWPDESRHAAETGYDRSVLERAQTRFKHFISQEKPYWEDRIDIRDLFRVHFVEPQQSFDRLRRHDGAFMLSAFHERLEASEVNRKVNQAASYQHFKLRVPHWAKGKIRRQLQLLGVTDESLRGDFQSAAEAVEAKYKVDEQARCDRCHEARQERERPETDSLSGYPIPESRVVDYWGHPDSPSGNQRRRQQDN